MRPVVALAVVAALAGAARAETPPPRRDGFLAELSLAGGYRYALTESFGGAEAQVVLGVENRQISTGGLFSVDAGRSRFGLPFEILRWGGLIRWKLGARVRLGVGLSAGVMIIQRVTDPESMVGFICGGLVDAGVDLYRAPGGGTLFTFARGTVDFLDAVEASAQFSAGATAGLGWRF
jgi:hypothetical protein